jgi:hypothetical protein
MVHIILDETGRPRLRPLFIPLRRKFYDAFCAGIKTIEYRRYGPRWNEKTCMPGRLVTLSLGYGKQHRIKGTIIKFSVAFIQELEAPVQQAWAECFPNDYLAACIQIEIEKGEM